ncbi:MAG: FixH family protein [Woeseiaceae bacterium]
MIDRGMVLLFLLLALQSQAFAHGGVVEEDDICVIKVNYLRAHFKIYQPRTSGHEQFCEDLPAAAESVFVMEFMHDALETMPIDFRIIRDITGKGRFARMEDVQAIEDLDAATVFYQSASTEPDVYSVVHTFESEGDFIGIVSARNPESGDVYAAVFPFEVGFTGWGYWPLFIGLLVLIQIQYFAMSGRLKRWFSRTSPATLALAALLLPIPEPAHAGEFIVTYTTPDGPPEINRMHSWILYVESDTGEPIEGAEIEVDGGMPAHDHGLPTQPRVTEDLGGGYYRLDGVRFHMSGYWEMVVTIRSDEAEDTVVIPLTL